ncbi:hypothetical protein Tco_1556792 [Tanacetum coccineum]
MSAHTSIYIAYSHTKKVFRNMRRLGKGFFGKETPLFQIMMVQAQEEMAEVDEATNEEMDDSLVRAATTATILDADLGSGPRRQDTIGDTIAQTRYKNVSKTSNDPLLSRENKTTQDAVIDSLKRRVKKLERKKSRTQKLHRMYKGRKIAEIDKDAEIILVDET